MERSLRSTFVAGLVMYGAFQESDLSEVRGCRKYELVLVGR